MGKGADLANSDSVATEEVARVCSELVSAIGQVMVGKESVVRQALVTLLAGGHLLIEDVPGTGKTTLARTLARQGAGCQLQTHSVYARSIAGRCCWRQSVSQ